jgi:hypothetical protein
MRRFHDLYKELAQTPCKSPPRMIRWLKYVVVSVLVWSMLPRAPLGLVVDIMPFGHIRVVFTVYILMRMRDIGERCMVGERGVGLLPWCRFVVG